MESALIRHSRDTGQGRGTPQLLHQDAVLRGAGRFHAYRHLVAGPQGSVLARRASRWYLRPECEFVLSIRFGDSISIR